MLEQYFMNLMQLGVESDKMGLTIGVGRGAEMVVRVRAKAIFD
jgi:hypothetical protein